MLAGDRFHVSARPDTLYDTLGVVDSASPRRVRKIVTALRRDAATAEDLLHEVCLAGEVLGDPEHKAHYDRLLARMRAAGAPMPTIGPAMEGTRLGPAVSARVVGVARTGGSIVKGLFGVAFVIGLLVLIAMVIGSRSSSRPSYQRIEIPQFKLNLPPPPVIDYSKLRLDLPTIDSAKLRPPTLELEPAPRAKPRTLKPRTKPLAGSPPSP